MLDDLSAEVLENRHHLVVHQMGQRQFARGGLDALGRTDPLERALRDAELAIADGHGGDRVDDLMALAGAHRDREAWLVAAAAHRSVADEEGLRRCLAEADALPRGPYRAGHRGALAHDLHAWIDADQPVDHAVFVGGAGRSGTTLLRAMLHAHPALHAGPELKILPHTGVFVDRVVSHGDALAHAGLPVDDVVSSFDAFVRSVVQAVPTAGLRLVEKTPANVIHMLHLARCFPASRFLHLLRDGRDVVASLLQQRWVDPQTGGALPICHDATAAAGYWRDTVLRARFQTAWLLGRVLEVRYEALVTDPAGVMAKVLAFLGEPWSDAVLHHPTAATSFPASESSSASASRPVSPSSVGRWAKALSVEDRAAVSAVAGDLLWELGYDAPPRVGV